MRLDSARCSNCASLREANDLLRLQLDHLNAENARLSLRLEELSSAASEAHIPSRHLADPVNLVFTSDATEAAALLRDPLVLLRLRSLRYHEQRLDTLVMLQSSLENELRARP